jgi:hypothetical protein
VTRVYEPSASASFSQHIYAFGSPAGSIFGHMVLGPDGSVLGYEHPNEARWQSPADGVLEFVSKAGKVTSCLKRHSSAMWLGRFFPGRLPAMLVSALHHEGPGTASPTIIVNSIPKSGTYFLTAALEAAGLTKSGLHISGRRGVVVNSGLPESQWHRNPALQFLDLPVELVPLIARGAVTPAHVEHYDVVARMRKYGIHVLHVKRNLRDVLLSLYQFKLNRVDPISALDRSWRELPETQRLCGFLYFYAERDVPHIRAMAMHVAKESSLSYDDMILGRVSDSAKPALEAIRPGLSDHIADCLRGVTDAPTSTLSNVRSDWTSVWTDEIEAVFAATGLKEANHLLGYE